MMRVLLRLGLLLAMIFISAISSLLFSTHIEILADDLSDANELLHHTRQKQWEAVTTEIYKFIKNYDLQKKTGRALEAIPAKEMSRYMRRKNITKMSEMLPQDFERLLKRNGESRPELLAWIKLVTGADVLTWKEMDHLFQIIREDRPLDYPPLLWVIMFGNPANEEEKEKWSDCVKDAYTVAADKKSRQLCLLFATVAASRLFLKERDSKVLKGLREWFERICSQQPQSEQKESAFFLGMLAFIQGDFIQAARHMEIAATIEPAARFWSALCSLFAKNYSEAEKKFVSLKKDIPASSLDPKILEKLINLCRKRR